MIALWFAQIIVDAIREAGTAVFIFAAVIIELAAVVVMFRLAR